MDEQTRKTEVLEGYVVDNACIRKSPRADLLERARAHTTRCALMGHCIESGYGLVDDQGGAALLDTQATPEVVRVLRASDRERGVRLRVHRGIEGEEMRTTAVEEL